MAAALSEFAAAVRAHDWPRHIAIQFAPESKRGDLTALFVFNAEIDRITRNASDPLPGEIRLQWWREVLNGEREGEARRHPLASVLLDVIHQHDLPLGTFGRFLEAKTFALYHDAFPDTYSFEAWCGETEGALLQMAACACYRFHFLTVAANARKRPMLAACRPVVGLRPDARGFL